MEKGKIQTDQQMNYLQKRHNMAILKARERQAARDNKKAYKIFEHQRTQKILEQQRIDFWRKGWLRAGEKYDGQSNVKHIWDLKGRDRRIAIGFMRAGFRLPKL